MRLPFRVLDEELFPSCPQILLSLLKVFALHIPRVVDGLSNNLEEFLEPFVEILVFMYIDGTLLGFGEKVIERSVVGETLE